MYGQPSIDLFRREDCRCERNCAVDRIVTDEGLSGLVRGHGCRRRTTTPVGRTT